jgi:small subunit ribosomal protein S7
MSRKGNTKTKIISKDPIYQSTLVTKLINRSMKDGKKSVAQKQVYNAFSQIKQKTKKDPVKIFTQALENIKPVMEVRSRRIGGAAYQVPSPVKPKRAQSLSIRWLVESARQRPNSDFHTYADKLEAEITDASKGEGLAIKKKEEIEKIAEANRAFAHFRW